MNALAPKPLTVICGHCQGRGHTPLGRGLRETYEALPASGECSARQIALMLGRRHNTVIARLHKLRAVGLMHRNGTPHRYLWSRA